MSTDGKPKQSDRIWYAMFKRVIAFKRQHGHARVPIGYHDQTLAIWVRTQRGNAGRKPGSGARLSAARHARLEAIGFEFTVQGSAWEVRFDQLGAWARQHGDCNVPRFDEQVPGLGIWLSAQRSQHREGRLEPARRQRLEALGVAFEVRELRWTERIAALGAYRKRHGHTNVSKHTRADQALGQWVVQQRRRFKSKRLSAVQIADLEGVGVWLQREPQWETRFKELLAFKEDHGHLHPSTDLALGAWTSKQRKDLSRGSLLPERARRLKAIGFNAETRYRYPEHPLWKKKLELLTAFRKEHGHCFPPLKHPQLGAFVGDMRGRRNQGRLAADMEERLDALGFEWNAHDASWEQALSELVDFKARNGHVLGPFRVHHPALSQWVCTQRRYKRKGKLDPRRIARLEALGFEWEGFKGRTPMSVEVDLIADFRRRNGHLAIPDEPPHRQLFAWAREQRGLFGTGKLHTRTKAELLELEFPFTRTELEWERSYANLKSQHERFGHIRKAAGELAKWVEQQRRAQLAGKLSLAQEDRLLELGVFN